ncbi:ABC transporter ATP-binding protein [Aestuariimicrobium kwangyangense]|uniref:ABC transporter ATP-binding protein n=1 Tax=Aestuariimicrobium kwangyangense TaxID=396389 RepID=UPI0003B446C9|nr:ATP-binding cassette domain-containing protein [Aestuariimicrobium kwangyangense]
MDELSSPAMIEVDALVKEFRTAGSVDGRLAGLRRLWAPSRLVRAVDGVSFTIQRGEVVGYLGANGAGKSTTIKMLTGIVRPTSGTVRVNGVVPWQNRRAHAHNIGVVFGQKSQLWYDLPLRVSLETIRDLYRVEDRDYRARLAEFDEVLGVRDFLDTPIRSLSLGQRMRGDLVGAMLYRPEVLYLDEPTVGLDVVAKQALREFIAAQNQQYGTTVVITTHDMDDIEQLCRRIVMIDHGSVVYDGDLPVLKKRYLPFRDVVITPADDSDAALIRADHSERIEGEDGTITLRFDPDVTTAPAVIAQAASATGIDDLKVIEPDLEDVVRLIYAEAGR